MGNQVNITAPQQAQAPSTAYTGSTTIVSTGQLTTVTQFTAVYTSSADKFLATISPGGTIAADSSLDLQVSTNGGTVYEKLASVTGANLIAGIAQVFEVGFGALLRFKFNPGSTGAGANGPSIRFKN